MLTVDKKRNGSNMVVALKGRLDTSTAPQLDEEVADLEGVSYLEIDLAELEYVSSAGLRVLLSTQRKMIKNEGNMIIKNLSRLIKEIFEVTGFSDILNVEN